MEMSLNRVESIPSKNIIAEKKGVGLTLIVDNVNSINTLLDCDDICDGDIWEWNLINGTGNDVY